MDKGAPALGIIADSQYIEQKIQLRKDDLFIAYSDGVTEARNEAGIFFGEGAFNTLLVQLEGSTAKYAGNKILEVIENFIGESQATDDLSLIILRPLN